MHLSLNLLGVVFSSSRRTKVLSGLIPDIRFLIYPIYIHRQPYIHSRTLPPFTWCTRTHDTLLATAFVAQLVERRSRFAGREFNSYRRHWSCIFRYFSRLRERNIYPYRLPHMRYGYEISWQDVAYTCNAVFCQILYYSLYDWKYLFEKIGINLKNWEVCFCFI